MSADAAADARIGPRRRILILNWRDISHPQAGGAERYLNEIAKRMVRLGHDVRWLTAGYPDASPTERIDSIEISRIGNRASVYALLPFAYLRRYRGTFDAIVDAENGIPFFSPFFSRTATILLVFHVHQRVFEKHLHPALAAVFKWLEGTLMPLAYRHARYVAISKDTKQDLEALGVAPDRIDLAYAGIDSTLRPGPKSARPRILSVGRLKPYKRIDVLVRAMPAILARCPETELVIAGGGESKDELAALVASLHLERSVTFEDVVDEWRKAELYRSAWVFAMPSEMEGWGMTILEANASGTPAVGFDVPGVREAIVDGTSGIVVPDEQSFAHALADVLSDERLRVELERGALARSAEFSWERTTAVFLEAIEAQIARST